jgi:hypothetical protein
MHRNISLTLSAAIVAITVIGCAFRQPYHAPEYRDPIVAIDVALEADRTPPDPSGAVRPYVTLLQGFIKDSNLHAMASSMALVMATTDLERVTVPSWELRRLQERTMEAFAPFAIDPTDDTSLITTPDGSRPGSSTIHNVLCYVPNSTGTNYRPQVVSGGGQATASAAGFKPAGAAVYQLDRAGIAQKTLWTWPGTMGTR